MALRVATNIQSMAAMRAFSKSSNEYATSSEKLAAGRRIVRARDDAAGLAISETMRSRIAGSFQAKRNIQDGISIIQAAEGAMNEVSSIIVRMRQLTVAAASDTMSQHERKMLNIEYNQLKSEVDRLHQTAGFHGMDIINNSPRTRQSFQVGVEGDPFANQIMYDLASVTFNTSDLDLKGTSLSSKGSAQKNLENLVEAQNRLSKKRAEMGSIQNRLVSALANLETTNENLSRANSQIRDVDVAKESANQAKAAVLRNASATVLVQANSMNKDVVRLLS